jgi:putative membrane protein
MAGIFYLPRLFVHHSEKVNIPSDTDTLFSMMESKLLKVIMTPAMIATWGFGLSLAIIPGVLDWSEVWPWVKLILYCGNDMVSFLAREATARF